MFGLSTQRAPSPTLVVPYFIFSAIAFLIFSVLLFFSIPELSMHFMNPKILALTHFAALGWISMIIMGALYQLVPVIFETGLYSQKLGKFNFIIFGTGILGMVWSFWTLHFKNWLFLFGGLVFLAFMIFSFNIFKSISRSAKSHFAGKLVLSAIFWLLITGLLGFLLTLNYTFPFLKQDQFNLLKTHAHFGMIGWLLFLVMGVSAVLIPMFLVSHDLKEGFLKKALYICNFALLLISIDLIVFAGTQWIPVYLLIFFFGFSYFLRYIFDSYRKKLRKLDIGMKHSMISFVFLLIPGVLAVFLSLSGWKMMPDIHQLIIPYGMSIFIGFFSNLILGQMYKTLPFILWLHRYKHLVGKNEIPMPKDLYSESLAQWQYYIYLLAVLFFALGFLFEMAFLLYSGAALLILTALLFNINVLIIVLFKKQSTSIGIQK